MASVPQRLGEDRTTVPRIVLPITSRGLVVTDRLCWALLGAAMVAAAGLILYLNRGTTFFVDELGFLFSSSRFTLRDVLQPDNGHLVATTRVVYRATLDAFGVDYLAFRLLAVAAVVTSAGLFYALVKRRIGALPALAPTLVILFLGTDAQHVMIPVGFTLVLSVAAGLGALLALEQANRRGDAFACALLVLSVATFSTGLAFLVGVAISILLRPDRRRRAWVFLLPLALYAAWWLWSLDVGDSGDQEVHFIDALLIPNYIADSLAAVAGSLAGLSYDFIDPSSRLAEVGWGRVLAVAAVVALVLRIRRGNVPLSLWVSLGIVLTYWMLGALAAREARGPALDRYMYMGAIAALLVATDAARNVRFSKLGLAILFAVCALSLATNLAQMREPAASFRDSFSPRIRAELAMFELAGDNVGREFPRAPDPELFPDLARAAAYLAAVDRFGGSAAFSTAELERQPESVRQGADQALARVLALDLESPVRDPSEGCRQLRSNGAGEAIPLKLPAGGASLRVRGAAPASLSVGRFATSPSAEVGSLSPGETAALSVPRDSSSRPWIGSLTGASSVQVCALR